MVNKFQGGNVINLKRKDFDSSFKLKKAPGKDGLIVWFANWCGYCVQLAPQYKELSKKSGIKLYAVEVDTSGCQDVFEHYMVQGFPSIRFISKTGNIDMNNYMGERDVASMMKYIKEKGTTGGAKKVVKKTQCGGAKCKKNCKCKKVVKKTQCGGSKCKKNCKCKKVAKKSGCKKCEKCKGGKCNAHKGGSIKSVKKVVKKVVKKAVKSVKKMVGGKKITKKTKRKPTKKTNKRRKKK
jgi:thiol-disulfide isomerase/thioredoxin